MLMSDIIQRFRDENPELDTNVITDSTLISWLLVGDQEVCAKARLIVQEGVSITVVSGQSTYDLTKLNSKFFDINEIPGGGICQFNSNNYKRLTKTTKSSLDFNNSQWRRASNGVPKYYYRSGPNIVVHPPPDSTITSITVDMILLSDPFNNLGISPFNQIPYLQPFHVALELYLVWRAKIKIGKAEESDTALKAYTAYVEWMVKVVGGGKWGPIEFRPSGLPSQGYQR